MVKSTRRRWMMGASTAAVALGLGRRPARAEAPKLKKVILVVASGGWDTTYALDPKPGLDVDIPPGELRTFADLALWVHAERPETTAFFERYAELCAVVHGVSVQSVVHTDAARRILTGTASNSAPDLGAIVAHAHGGAHPVPYLVLGRTSFAGPHAAITARTGTANQLGTLLDPWAEFPVEGEPVTDRFIPDSTERGIIADYLDARIERVREARGLSAHNRTKLDEFVASLERGDALTQIGSLGELDYTRDFSVQIDLALEALQRELCTVVQLEIDDWDTHTNNARQALLHESLFSGLGRLLEGLMATPGSTAGSSLFDESLVVVLSELGRTPRLNDTGGKDHWPFTSAMLLGPDLVGGRSYGGTDDGMLGRPIDFASGQPASGGQALQYGNLVAGVLRSAGVDPAMHLPGWASFSPWQG